MDRPACSGNDRPLPPAVGNVPATAIDASTPGSGKGKIVGLCSIIATGDEPARSGWPSIQKSKTKRLEAMPSRAADYCFRQRTRWHLEPMLGKRSHNANLWLSCPWRARNHDVPFRSIVTFTGNNLSFVGDMIRRIIIGRLGPQTEHPDKLRPKTSVSRLLSNS